MAIPLTSTPIPSNITGCGPARFNYTACAAASDLFVSHEVTGNCPTGETGQPVTVPGGKFTSTLSQADADAQAATYLAAELAQNCAVLPAPVITSGTLSIHGNSTFNWPIVATNSPMAYAASSGTPGLSVITTDQEAIIQAQGGSLANTLVINPATGVISGSVGNINSQINPNPAPGNYTINISATNGAGTATGTLTITMLGYLTIAVAAATLSNSGSAQPTGLFVNVSLDGGPEFLAAPGSTYVAYKSLQVLGSGNVALERQSSGASTAALQQSFTITPTGTVNLSDSLSTSTESMTFPSLAAAGVTGTPLITSACTAGTHIFDLSANSATSPAAAHAGASANPFSAGAAYTHQFSTAIVNTAVNTAFECGYNFQLTLNF